MSDDLSRRDAFGLMGGFGLSLVAAACSSGSKSAIDSSSSSSSSCALSPELTQGPFWLTDHPEVANVVQDRQGAPLALRLTVVDASCALITGAKVDIWHCDANGDYAGVPLSGGPGGGGLGGAAPRST